MLVISSILISSPQIKQNHQVVLKLKFIIVVTTLVFVVYKFLTLSYAFESTAKLKSELPIRRDNDGLDDRYNNLGCFFTVFYICLVLYYMICGTWVSNIYFFIFCVIQSVLTVKDYLDHMSNMTSSSDSIVRSLPYRLIVTFLFDAIHVVVVSYAIWYK